MSVEGSSVASGGSAGRIKLDFSDLDTSLLSAPQLFRLPGTIVGRSLDGSVSAPDLLQGRGIKHALDQSPQATDEQNRRADRNLALLKEAGARRSKQLAELESLYAKLDEDAKAAEKEYQDIKGHWSYNWLRKAYWCDEIELKRDIAKEKRRFAAETFGKIGELRQSIKDSDKTFAEATEKERQRREAFGRAVTEFRSGNAELAKQALAQADAYGVELQDKLRSTFNEINKKIELDYRQYELNLKNLGERLMQVEAAKRRWDAVVKVAEKVIIITAAVTTTMLTGGAAAGFWAVALPVAYGTAVGFGLSAGFNSAHVAMGDMTWKEAIKDTGITTGECLLACVGGGWANVARARSMAMPAARLGELSRIGRTFHGVHQAGRLGLRAQLPSEALNFTRQIRTQMQEKAKKGEKFEFRDVFPVLSASVTNMALAYGTAQIGAQFASRRMAIKEAVAGKNAIDRLVRGALYTRSMAMEGGFNVVQAELALQAQSALLKRNITLEDRMAAYTAAGVGTAAGEVSTRVQVKYDKTAGVVRETTKERIDEGEAHILAQTDTGVAPQGNTVVQTGKYRSGDGADDGVVHLGHDPRKVADHQLAAELDVYRKTMMDTESATGAPLQQSNKQLLDEINHVAASAELGGGHSQRYRERFADGVRERAKEVMVEQTKLDDIDVKTATPEQRKRYAKQLNEHMEQVAAKGRVIRDNNINGRGRDVVGVQARVVKWGQDSLAWANNVIGKLGWPLKAVYGLGLRIPGFRPVAGYISQRIKMDWIDSPIQHALKSAYIGGTRLGGVLLCTDIIFGLAQTGYRHSLSVLRATGLSWSKPQDAAEALVRRAQMETLLTKAAQLKEAGLEVNAQSVRRLQDAHREMSRMFYECHTPLTARLQNLVHRPGFRLTAAGLGFGAAALFPPFAAYGLGIGLTAALLPQASFMLRHAGGLLTGVRPPPVLPLPARPPGAIRQAVDSVPLLSQAARLGDFGAGLYNRAARACDALATFLCHNRATQAVFGTFRGDTLLGLPFPPGKVVDVANIPGVRLGLGAAGAVAAPVVGVPAAIGLSAGFFGGPILRGLFGITPTAGTLLLGLGSYTRRPAHQKFWGAMDGGANEQITVMVKSGLEQNQAFSHTRMIQSYEDTLVGLLTNKKATKEQFQNAFKLLFDGEAVSDTARALILSRLRTVAGLGAADAPRVAAPQWAGKRRPGFYDRRRASAGDPAGAGGGRRPHRGPIDDGKKDVLERLSRAARDEGLVDEIMKGPGLRTKEGPEQNLYQVYVNHSKKEAKDAMSRLARGRAPIALDEVEAVFARLEGVLSKKQLARFIDNVAVPGDKKTRDGVIQAARSKADEIAASTPGDPQIRALREMADRLEVRIRPIKQEVEIEAIARAMILGRPLPKSVADVVKGAAPGSGAISPAARAKVAGYFKRTRGQRTAKSAAAGDNETPPRLSEMTDAEFRQFQDTLMRLLEPMPVADRLAMLSRLRPLAKQAQRDMVDARTAAILNNPAREMRTRWIHDIFGSDARAMRRQAEAANQAGRVRPPEGGRPASLVDRSPIDRRVDQYIASRGTPAADADQYRVLNRYRDYLSPSKIYLAWKNYRLDAAARRAVSYGVGSKADADVLVEKLLANPRGAAIPGGSSFNPLTWVNNARIRAAARRATAAGDANDTTVDQFARMQARAELERLVNAPRESLKRTLTALEEVRAGHEKVVSGAVLKGMQAGDVAYGNLGRRYDAVGQVEDVYRALIHPRDNRNTLQWLRDSLCFLPPLRRFQTRWEPSADEAATARRPSIWDGRVDARPYRVNTPWSRGPRISGEIPELTRLVQGSRLRDLPADIGTGLRLSLGIVLPLAAHQFREMKTSPVIDLYDQSDREFAHLADNRIYRENDDWYRVFAPPMRSRSIDRFWVVPGMVEWDEDFQRFRELQREVIANRSKEAARASA